MSEHWVFLRPIDRVYFGPPKAQVAGEVHGGRSEFPPSPYAVAGMLRTKLLEGAEPALDLDDWSHRARDERRQLVGTASELPPGWQLVGPFPASECVAGSPTLEPWLPTPAWVRLGDGDGLLHPYQPMAPRARSASAVSENPGRFLADDDPQLGPWGYWVGSGRTQLAEHTPGWLPARLLRDCLRQSAPVDARRAHGLGPWMARRQPREEVAAVPPFVRWEKAPGVAIDPTSGTASDQMLYTLGMLRFASGSGVVAALSAPLDRPLGASSLTGGVVRAGRKGQVAAVETAEGRVHGSWSELVSTEHLVDVEEGTTFWLYLGTPARLNDPYQDVLAAVQAEAPPGLRVQLMAVVIGAPLVIGGMAVDGGVPRDNALYAPAGSGWLLRFEGGDAESRRATLRRFHSRCTLGLERERAFGFGFTLVGNGARIPVSATPRSVGASGNEERS